MESAGSAGRRGEAGHCAVAMVTLHPVTGQNQEERRMPYHPRHDISKIVEEMGPMPDHLVDRFIAMTVDYYRRHPENLPEDSRRMLQLGSP